MCRSVLRHRNKHLGGDLRPSPVFRALVIGGVVLFTATFGCEEYRIEHHRRPSYYQDAALGELPDRITLADGTVIVYETINAPGDLKSSVSGEKNAFQIREEFEDGSVVLRARVPEQVLANTLTCLRNQEYELLWEQLLSEQTKRSYQRQGKGVEDFANYFAQRRNDLARTINRMMLGIPRNEVVMENLGGGVIRIRFHPQVGRLFRFKTVDVVSEGPGLKLLMIH